LSITSDITTSIRLRSAVAYRQIAAVAPLAVPRCMNPLAIDVHHIDGNPANNDPSNLIALCPTCHSAFHRGTYSLEAIRVWKLMLQQLNAAYDRNTINLLLMLARLEESGWKNFEITGDGFLAFSPLLVSGLIKVNIFHRPAMGRGMPYYEVTLSEQGQATMKAWKEGNPAALPRTETTGA
jgi:HNH endonuclease